MMCLIRHRRRFRAMALYGDPGAVLKRFILDGGKWLAGMGM